MIKCIRWRLGLQETIMEFKAFDVASILQPFLLVEIWTSSLRIALYYSQALACTFDKSAAKKASKRYLKLDDHDFSRFLFQGDKLNAIAYLPMLCALCYGLACQPPTKLPSMHIDALVSPTSSSYNWQHVCHNKETDPLQWRDTGGCSS